MPRRQLLPRSRFGLRGTLQRSDSQGSHRHPLLSSEAIWALASSCHCSSPSFVQKTAATARCRQQSTGPQQRARMLELFSSGAQAGDSPNRRGAMLFAFQVLLALTACNVPTLGCGRCGSCGCGDQELPKPAAVALTSCVVNRSLPL